MDVFNDYGRNNDDGSYNTSDGLEFNSSAEIPTEAAANADAKTNANATTAAAKGNPSLGSKHSQRRTGHKRNLQRGETRAGGFQRREAGADVGRVAHAETL